MYHMFFDKFQKDRCIVQLQENGILFHRWKYDIHGSLD